VEYVQQEINVSSNKSALELVIDASRKSLFQQHETPEGLIAERAALENSLVENPEGDESHDMDKMEETVARLCEIEDALSLLGIQEDGPNIKELNEHSRNKSVSQAKELLLQLSFSADQLQLPLKQLSGGYRMRVAIACAIISRPNIILLDEPTNHMDLHGVIWLERFIKGCLVDKSESNTSRKPVLNYPNFKSMIIVSHDQRFLDNVITDVILFYEKRLQYFLGTYSAYKDMCDEKDLRLRRLIEKKSDAEKKAREMAAKQAKLASKSKKGRKGHGVDPNKQRQAAEKMRKAHRAGFYRDDGKRYHTMSLYTTTKTALPQSVSISDLKKDKLLKFKFPTVNPQELRLSSIDATLIHMDKVSFQYDNDLQNKKAVLEGVTLQVNLRSRVAIVGENGAGKTTLLKLLCNKLQGSGEIARHPNLRTAMVSQHHIEMLRDHMDTSAAQYLKSHFSNVKEVDARSHLGLFGLAGDLALQPVRKLSGGQKARLALAIVMWEKPHVLILDEPTNHLDMDSIRALAMGLNDFQGAVLLVSHNQGFLSEVCHELWSVSRGKVKVTVGVEKSKDCFDEIFSEYVKSIK